MFVKLESALICSAPNTEYFILNIFYLFKEDSIYSLKTIIIINTIVFWGFIIKN